MRRQSIESITEETGDGVFLFRFMARQEDKIKKEDRDKKTPFVLRRLFYKGERM